MKPDQAPEGTKSLSNRLPSAKCTCDTFLWKRASQPVGELLARALGSLAIWDESVTETPESIALEGLRAVRSRKAARLKRSPGFSTRQVTLLSPYRACGGPA